ncbi:shikimate kinase [Haloglomus halophilum]|uniref:shikimate kinase n=1 Tax=Haloglomus halophilum TaxID=2962672 RepID=UPI0020C94F96|nr:shikimate kinase [Haloglomus halophilum]
MEGRAAAPGAGTVLNALANGSGSAFAIDARTTATVELDDSGSVTGEIAGAPDADTRLIERCVELVCARHGDGVADGGHVRTESAVPMAAGLKSSSAAANATVLATLDALDRAPADALPDAERAHADAPTRAAACRLGVEAARDAGVTVTGAFDDASASMLGGVTVTDNTEDTLLTHETLPTAWRALVWTPEERAFSADADVARCERIAPVADLVRELALDGDYARAMTVNGFAFCAALGFPADPAVEALPDAAGASLSGTGPSFVAVGTDGALDPVAARWQEREGRTRRLALDTAGGMVAR